MEAAQNALRLTNTTVWCYQQKTVDEVLVRAAMVVLAASIVESLPDQWCDGRTLFEGSRFSYYCEDRHFMMRPSGAHVGFELSEAYIVSCPLDHLWWFRLDMERWLVGSRASLPESRAEQYPHFWRA